MTFNANGGSGGKSVTQDYGSALAAPTVTRAGYTFIGWSPAVPSTVPASNTTYTAQWQINQYEVAFDANGGVGGATNEQDYGSAIVAPEVMREGYTFAGWQPALPETVPASNTTYMAQWQINQYGVAFNANGGDGGKSVTQDFGTALTAPIVTRTGYTFAGWSPDVDATVPASNVTYTAQWKINQYEVTFDANGGIGSVTNEQDYASEIVAPEVSREGYTFTGWLPEVYETVPASNVTYMAQWEINQYAVVFDGNGGALGDDALPSVTNTQDYGSAIVAPTATREGYTFTGWQPEVDATVPASNVTYMAQWVVNQYAVTFDGNGGVLGESAMPNVTYIQDYGSAIVAPAATRDWCTFAGWQPAVAATVPALNVTFTAQWARWGDSISAPKIGGKTMSELYPAEYMHMTTVVLEDGITKLPTGFFDGCDKVEFVTWPSTLVEFGIDDLPLKIRASLTYDGKGFIIYNGWLLDYQDKDAASLDVPEGIVGIGAGALAGMYDLEMVTLPQSLKYIATGAFREDTYLDNLVIPDGVEIIGESAFEDCSFLQTMTLGKVVKSVGARAFAGCTQLSGAVFADGLLDVGTEAFNGCWRMQSVSLPLSTTNVASSAFSGCTSLTGVTVPTHGGKMSEWFAPIYSRIRDVTVPDGETEVRTSMFEGCGSLQTVQMPDFITNIAARAFYGCSSLPEARLPESLLTVGDEAFRNCSSLTAAALPENVTSIGARAFQGCSNLSAFTLPRGLESLPDYVFADCWLLDSFVVPAAVTNLGNYIVSGRTTAIYYLGNAPAYGANVYGNASGSLTSYVILGTKGWDGRPNSRDIPASWNGRDILTWSANQFDVTFDANGGLFFPVVTNTYACEETTYTGYSLPPFEPVRKGMDFDGYWTEPNGGTRVFTSTRVLLTKPHTLYAHWKKGMTIKVRFNACGGTVSPDEDDYVAERPYCELPVPVREHFAFAGWWTEANGGSRIEISSEVPKAAHELFAHWTPNVYTIRFHANNGTDTTVDQSFTYGQTVTLMANTFGSEGNAFAGWSLSADGPAVYADKKTLTDVSAIQDNVIHLYAVWVSTRYAVRFDSHGGVGRMENQTLVKDEESPLNVCTFTRTGYVFAGWAGSTTGEILYGDGENVVNVYEKTGADLVLYAVWEPISYSIHYLTNGGSGAMEDQPMVYDEEVPLVANQFTMAGALFRGWATTADGAVEYREQASVKNLTAVADDVVTLYAVWLEKPASVVAIEDAFDGSGTVALDENDNIVVTVTNDISGTVEIPDNVGNVTIDLNGHNIVGDNGGAGIRIVSGQSGEGAASPSGDATQLVIEDTSEGEKGVISGDGDGAGIEVDEDAAQSVHLDVDDCISVLNGDGTEQEWNELNGIHIPGYGKVTVPKTWKVGQKVTWKATAEKGSVFAHWEGDVVDSLGLSRNMLRNPSLQFTVPSGFDTNGIQAVFIAVDDDRLGSLALSDVGPLALKSDLAGMELLDDSESYVTASVSGLPTGLKFDAKNLVITGKPTKAGAFTVKITAKNASGYQWAENVVLRVADAAGNVAPEPAVVPPKRTAYYPLTVVSTNTVAGTVTGTGVYAEGKKVSVSAKPAKGYVFAGWYRDPKFADPMAFASGDFLKASQSVVVPEARYLFAKFITDAEDKAAIGLAVDGIEMAAGAYRTNIWCGVYLEWPVAASALSEVKVKVAGLPSGLKFTDKPVTSKIGTGKTAVTVTNVPAYTIYGAPTAASKAAVSSKPPYQGYVPSQVKITVTTAGKSSQTYQIDATVDALPEWAQGAYSGGFIETALPDNGGHAGRVTLPCGTVSLTVDAKGKISGKALGDGLTYTLAAPYYSAFALDENQASNFLADVTASWSYKDGTKTIKTNEVIQLVVHDNGIGGVVVGGPQSSAAAAAEDSRPPDAAAAAEGGGGQGLAALPELEAGLPELVAWQYNWKVDPWKALGKKFDKQTMAYAILADGSFSDDEEDLTSALGADVVGRVTLKFAATGAVTIAGEFVTGYNEKTQKYTTAKASGSATLVPVDEDGGYVFIYLTPKGLPPHARCVDVPWPR